MSRIDWSDPSCPISSYFTVKEAIWLPHWNRLASAGDGLDIDACSALVVMFGKMDLVREFLGRPIRVHVAYRPKAYNLEIGGASESCHIARRDEDGALIAAVDFDAKTPEEDFAGESCDRVRGLLLPKIVEWDLRLEDNGPGAPWLHLDNKPVTTPGKSRFFKP